MNLTQAQVRHLVGITEEQFRSWRNAFVPLQSRSGQAPQYDLGDVLTLLVIAELVEAYGAKVSRLAPISSLLFEKCSQLVRSDDRASFLIVTPKVVRVISPETLHTLDSSSFVVPLRTMRSKMQSAILSASRNDDQLSLQGI